MLANILQALEVIALAILFSILFYSMNEREARNKRAGLNKAEIGEELK